ncbi:Nitrilase [Rhizina undulata]
MPLHVAVAQYGTAATLSSTLTLLRTVTTNAASSGINLLLFPEAFLGGYPRTTTFGAEIGSRTPEGREQFYEYWKQAVDLGDSSAEGLGVYESPGDGTREELESVARDTGVFLVVGIVEKGAGGTLWCAAVFIDPVEGIVGKRRKLMPGVEKTGTERVVWGQGSPKTLKAVTANIAGQEVTIGAAICWENYMPLLRTALYTQNVSLYLAPTADARESWISTMRHIAMEGRCYVLGSNQYVRRGDLPTYVLSGSKYTAEELEQVISAGGSVIVDPLGKIVAGPLWNETGVLSVEIEDLRGDVIKGKMDFDANQLGGHYSRSDVFKLEVEGLQLGK